MARLRFLVVAASCLVAGCSFVYDTRDLRGAGGDMPGGGGAGGAATTTTTGAGGGGGEACACDPGRDIVWLARADQVSPASAAPPCPGGAPAMADGAVVGSLLDESSQCGGPCTGPSRVKVAIDDSCGVGGEGIPNDATCHPKTLVPDSGGDTSLAINLEPIPCTLATPSLIDTATVTRASVCSPAGDGCAPPSSVRACVVSADGDCPDPCFPEPTSLAAVADDRSCDGVLSTCSPPVQGTLELHDDAACSGSPTGTWTILGAPICPATPSPPASPTTSYWRYTPDLTTCDAYGFPNGSVILEPASLALCCAVPPG